MIKSYAKINLHLGVLGRLSNNFHKIETLICFSDLHDKLYIKKSNYKNHQVKFNGKFSSDITKNSSIHKLFKILDKTKLLDGKKFDVNITKNIPLKSGMGGGSMNAATLLNYLIKRLKLKLKRKQIEEICNRIGSDVILGINRKPKIIFGNNKIKDLKKKIKFHIVLLKPRFGCKTSRIYENLNKFSHPLFNFKDIEKKNFKEFRNDLETSAFKIYPSLLKIKKEMEKLQNIHFARMTGSGSVIIAYFLRKKDAMTGTKYLKKKYKNYWCILSKTI
ncbi:MAG: 4-(cytidine 5'-diphospho)-2-C-methyl-D-erythritol kinase [Candidatus Pelagibacter sp.]|nr:4-(cytidine 5'-diphospho)-2-C-methyl-D-erythritol kinase [Candidatus Pelagibacter sp.]|tara:strand:+ start:9911 stop:10738 length:828 start_codon:yes stop_codon:yes gene_type:complete